MVYTFSSSYFLSVEWTRCCTKWIENGIKIKLNGGMEEIEYNNNQKRKENWCVRWFVIPIGVGNFLKTNKTRKISNRYRNGHLLLYFIFNIVANPIYKHQHWCNKSIKSDQFHGLGISYLLLNVLEPLIKWYETAKSSNKQFVLFCCFLFVMLKMTIVFVYSLADCVQQREVMGIWLKLKYRKLHTCIEKK